MKVISKYILKEIIRIFLLCQLIFILLFLVIDFIQKINTFIKAEVPLTTTLAYFLYKIPFYSENMIPVATMISIIVVICLMKKNMEIMAMKASGMDILKVFMPVIFISIILSLFSFFLSESIIPFTNSRQNEIWEVQVKKHSPEGFYGSTQIWYKSKNNIYWIKYFDAKTKTMKGPTFYLFDDQFHLTEKIKGKTCQWKNGVWEIKNAVIQKLKSDGTYSLKKLDRILFKIPETPATFIRKMKEPEDMNYAELKKHAERARAEGYDNTADLVNLYSKISFPFITTVFAILAIPIGLWQKLSGVPLSVAIGMAAGFLFWVVMGFADALGIAGILPPILSAWTANILFMLVGTNLLMNIKK